MLVVDVACGAAVVIAAITVLFPGTKARSTVPMLFLCAGTLIWTVSAHVRNAADFDTPGVMAFVFLGVAISASSGYVVVSRLVNARFQLPGLLLAAVVLVPLFTFLSTWFAWGLDDFTGYRSGPVFLVHAVFSFGFLAAMVVALSQRQYHRSSRVRAYVRVIQSLVVLIVVLEVAQSPYTHIVLTACVVVAVRAVRQSEEWWRAPVSADDLLDSIGVFLFVFDGNGLLRQWNSTADQLIRTVSPGVSLAPGTSAEDVLGRAVPFHDGTFVEFTIGGAVLGTVGHTHTIDNLTDSDGPDLVVMLRPVQSGLSPKALTTPSGALVGHDPRTQTVSRRATLDLLSMAQAAIRIDVCPTSDKVLVDEVMFVVARRLEATFGDTEWGRVDAWSFVAATTAAQAEHVSRALDDPSKQSLVHGLSASKRISMEIRESEENGESFALRVAQPLLRSNTGTGGPTSRMQWRD